MSKNVESFPEDNSSEETPEQQEMQKKLDEMVIHLQEKHDDDVKEEAGKLEEKQREKTFGERVFSEYQTKKSKIRGTEKERGAAFRFERGQIYKGYMNLRKEIKQAEALGENTTTKKSLLKQMREKAKVVQKDLDEINRQFYENVKEVEFENEFGKFMVPVVELDLKKDAEGKDIDPEKDVRIPEVFLGSVATQFHQSACFSMARALEGHKVFVPMQPEQPSVKKPENFGEILSKEGNLKPYSKLAKGVIETLGLKEFNLSGFSMGATTALELATDPELEGLNDLTIMEPLGIEDKGLVKLGIEFGVKQGIKTMKSSEARIKTLAQGAPEGQGEIGLFAKTANILSKKHFDPEKLSKINAKGRFQVWVGGESPIVDNELAEKVFSETDELIHEKNPEVSRLEFYKVNGADHGLAMMNSIGLSRMIDAKKPNEKNTTLSEEDLGNSAMEWIIKDIKE